MTNYSIVLLDMDGTFFDFEKTEQEAFFSVMGEFGLELSQRDYIRFSQINSDMWRELEKGNTVVEKLRLERFEKLFNEINIDHINIMQISERYLHYIAEGGYLFDGAKELWKMLCAKYRICIITNGVRWSQLSRLKKSGMMSYTEAVVTSEEVGKPKPNSEVFALAMDKMGESDISKYIMIGDSYTADILGAKKMGIDAIWYNPSGQRTDEQKSEFIVKSYDEIARILCQ